MTKPELILHVGMPKTGTAAIQAALLSTEWADALDGARIKLFPNRNSGNWTPFFYSLLRQPSWKRISHHEMNVERFATSIGIFLSKLPPHYKVLISAEAIGEIALRNKAGLTVILDFLSNYFTAISVAVHIREPLSYACSRIQQSVKAAHSIRRAVSSTLIRMDESLALSNLEEIFGARNVSPYSFDPALLISGDVVKDFATRALGVSVELQPAISIPDNDRNLGLTVEMANALVRFYQGRAITARDVAPLFVSRLGRIRWAGSKIDANWFTGDDRSRLLSTADMIRQKLRARFDHDPFPSYRKNLQPGIGGEKNLEEVHLENCMLLQQKIYRMRVRRKSNERVPKITIERSPKSGEEEIQRLLGEFYDACAAM